MSSFLKNFTREGRRSRNVSESFDERSKLALVGNNGEVQVKHKLVRRLAIRPRNSEHNDAIITKPPTIPTSVVPKVKARLTDGLVSSVDLAHHEEYMRSLGDERRLPSDFLRSNTISPRMRSILVVWMHGVTQRFEFKTETWVLACFILDRATIRLLANRKNYQLMGVAALMLAAKFEEVEIPNAADFLYISGDCATMSDLNKMEKELFRSVDYRLGFACPIYHLNKFCELLISKDFMSSKYMLIDSEIRPIHDSAKICVEILLITYSTAHFRPFVAAALSLYIGFIAARRSFPEQILVHLNTSRENLDLLARQFAPYLIDHCTNYVKENCSRTRAQLLSLIKLAGKNLIR